jgi:hypothetical protein
VAGDDDHDVPIGSKSCRGTPVTAKKNGRAAATSRAGTAEQVDANAKIYVTLTAIAVWVPVLFLAAAALIAWWLTRELPDTTDMLRVIVTTR